MFGGPKFICPNQNCGYRGKARKQARGSMLVFLFLLCLGVVPGLLYWAFKGGYRLVCPKCRLEIQA